MVGGKIIQNAICTFADGGKVYSRRQLWCLDGFDECAVFVEDTLEAADLKPGENIWWQGSTIYARKDTLKLKKIGFSHEP